MKEGDLENKVKIDHLNEEMSSFCSGILKDLEYLESKIAEALANQPLGDVSNPTKKKPNASQSPSGVGLIELSQD